MIQNTAKPIIGCGTGTLTIFEGPDGGGKTTAAKTFAAKTNAKYVHCGPMLGVKHGLARMYFEAMLPAVLGLQNIVLDRSWLSEEPYAFAMRNGCNRLLQADLLMLERVAMRCAPMVVLCKPSFDVVAKNYMSRPHLEYLNELDKLRTVHGLYSVMQTTLPKVQYDYTKHGDTLVDMICHARQSCGISHHYKDMDTAGNIGAQCIIVGDDFGERKEHDPFNQFPFVSFSNFGCSRWLTMHLYDHGINELNLFWTNSAGNRINELKRTGVFNDQLIIALGDNADRAIQRAGIGPITIAHPQYHKRFNARDKYPLADIINDYLLRGITCQS